MAKGSRGGKRSAIPKGMSKEDYERLSAKGYSRERMEKWVEKQKQKKIRQQQEDEQRATFTKEAKTITDGLKKELPEMTGSAKQIAWAEDIREQKLTAFEAFYVGSSMNPNSGYISGYPDAEKNIATMPRIFKTETSARYWIDTNKESIYQTVIRWNMYWNPDKKSR